MLSRLLNRCERCQQDLDCAGGMPSRRIALALSAIECQIRGPGLDCHSLEGVFVPTYQYACKECDHQFEVVQSFSDASLTDCPECQGPLRKLYGSVGVIFKGSGFYRTDSRSDSGSGSSSAKSSNGSSSGSSSDSAK